MSLAPLDAIRVPLAATTLIEASAGTGKTYTITTLYIRLLLELGLEVRQILVVTYTNAATAELRDRIRRRLREALVALQSDDAGRDETIRRLLDTRPKGDRGRDCALLGEAIRDFDEAAIFTIHGFCQRVLHEHAFESGVSFDAELVTELELLRDEVLRDFWARELVDASEAFVRYLQEDSELLEKLAKLVKDAVSNPTMPVVPDPVVEEVDLAPAEDAWSDAHSRAARIWKQEREKVLAVLCTSDALSHVTYKVDQIRATWAAQMDAEMLVARPGISRRFEKFRHFAAGKMNTKKNRAAPEHDFFDACARLLEAEEKLARALADRALSLRLKLVRYARDELQGRKEKANQQSFDDLLHRLAAALDQRSGATLAAQIRERYPAAMIDEYQDTDPVQYEIFRKIYVGGGGLLFLIGDPKQAIYSFRGADVFTYMRSRPDAEGREHTLDVNRRADPALLEAVSTLFRRAKTPFLFDRIPFPQVQAAPDARNRLGGSAKGRPPLEILLMPGESVNKTDADRRLPALIAAEIARFLTSGATIDDRPVEPGDLAVLCRKNIQARDTQVELRKLLVPAVFQGDSSVFDTTEALELERVLWAMSDPGDGRAVRAALATAVIGYDAEQLFSLQTSEVDWDRTVRIVAGLNDVWVTQGFVPALRRMLDAFGVPARLLERIDGERRLTNVLHVGELLQNAAAEAHRGPLALVEWLHRMRFDPASRGDLAAEAAQIRLESDARAVKLTTIHQAKGLEYPIVYCPFLWGNFFGAKRDGPVRFHDRDDQERLKLDLGSDDRARHVGWHDEEALAEDLRLLYVALTRAKHRSTVVWGSIKQAEASALGYLLHPPGGLGAGTDVNAITNAVAQRMGSRMRGDLAELVRDAGGSVEVRDLSIEPAVAYRESAGAELLLHCREARRERSGAWRTSSFSGLVSSGGRVSEPAEEGLDRDETADEAMAWPLIPQRSPARVILHDFPSGARPGELIHEIFQYLDFTNVEVASLVPEVTRRLGHHGFEDRWAEPLTRAIAAVVDTPLGDGWTLRQVANDRRLNELEFLFPVAGGGATFTPSRLATVFSHHRAPAQAPDYHQRLRPLEFRPLEGFLRGFIDMVFEHDGCWYLVDYKSNFLGPAPGDYGTPHVLDAMTRHHYILQYHLYTVALDRHLTARLAGYDYDRDFGGVYYLFVRGMSPEYPTGSGVFFDRPARALVDRLSAVLASPRSVEEAS